ncbi:MAG: site-specific DNA-methyltransferase [Candidatus Thorarchaeota archaeon]|nr:site-specific DNA-methyltransferase [Candidatus Thorarchaeota archaeon]
MSPESSKKKRKKRYVPHEAAARFKPTKDWTREEASSEFEKAKFSFPVDVINFEDCMAGMKSVPDESIDAVIADPPFGISFSGKEALYNRNDSFVIDGYQEVEGDYEEFTKAWISEIPRILKKSGSAWIFSGWTNLRPVLSAVEDAGLKLVNHIIWKYQFGVFTKKKFVTSHYHLLFLVKNLKQYFFNKIEHYPQDIWEINRTYKKGEKKNGTKLPTELVMRCIDFATKPGDLVLDPFMGNATTAVASKGSYRHFTGFEINESMREIINHNLSLLDIGELYVPYTERKDELVEKARAKFK